MVSRLTASGHDGRSLHSRTRSANGEQGTRVGKRWEAICGRRRQQNHTLFVSKDVGLLEPVTLVQVRKARTVGASIDGLDGAFSPMRSAQLAAGSYLFPVGKKYDLSVDLFY